MKHLKIFEDYTNALNKPIYNIGDYVEGFSNEFSNKEINVMRIIDMIFVDEYDGKNVYQYDCVLIEDEVDESNPEFDVNHIFTTEDYIIRKLTPKEVELYRVTNKYNL